MPLHWLCLLLLTCLGNIDPVQCLHRDRLKTLDSCLCIIKYFDPSVLISTHETVTPQAVLGALLITACLRRMNRTRKAKFMWRFATFIYKFTSISFDRSRPMSWQKNVAAKNHFFKFHSLEIKVKKFETFLATKKIYLKKTERLFYAQRWLLFRALLCSEVKLKLRS